MSFYDEYPGGKIVSRVTSDTEQFATVVTLTLNLLSQLLLFFLIAAVLFYINARLALLALTITPIIVGIAIAFRWIARRATRRSQRSLAQGQFQCAGGNQRHYSREELSPGTEHVQRVQKGK